MGSYKKRQFRVLKEKPMGTIAKKPRKNNNRSTAIKITIDNIDFQSKLEGFFYNKCKSEGIEGVEYEKTTYQVSPPFVFHGKKIQDIEYTPDFECTGKWFVEVKGRQWNERFPIVFKLFKKYLLDNKRPEKVYLLKTQEDINKFIKEIKK